jgi:hypothetical protein
VVTVSPEKVITEKIRLNATAREALKGIALDCLVAHAYPFLARFL